MAPISDHPLRYTLSGELHARPFPNVSAPQVVAFLAIKQAGEGAARDRDRNADMEHLVSLLQHYGAPLPDRDATHYYGAMGKFSLKWEQHTEFVTFTAFSEELSERPFDPAEFDVFPADWLEAAPGQRLTSCLLRLMPVPRKADKMLAQLRDWFVPESLAVGQVLDGAAVAASDFRIDPAGHTRFAVFVPEQTGTRRIGRIIQRLLEIETYKTMSMLGFALTREIGGQVNDMDRRISELMADMTAQELKPETTLDALLDVSVELENVVAQTSFRFAGTAAYKAIVDERISALREERFEGRQGFGEFMMRRYEPAMRTVLSMQERLERMSARALRASDLLRTRVDVERSAQNQAILESMDRRADLQLRLQHTVEGLSVVAISYYAVSLASYLLYPLTEVTGLSKGLLTSLVTLPVVLLVWAAVRRIRKNI
ncbi:DUF3422 family protein [Sulfitobacter donghicola]|uniref:Egg lysin n=1 Tax=Sulfitobacter donghicola DSW-25 = KCTC 12864 = JCM 14565 TaxID=1300350 RepID=A0A073IGB6_9RHOB|nr:DUF3422 domain-containing protein [Sulfitobacter donghicola]KEJ89388.1 hypothetical protein DSW25_10280 [Sulfitobacter donghicola DSW-25 = KCTC 12864 = JCM 14565]KIN69204.1 hypothetical protein Z948_2943 [Sulfitobacter donghicola DSW-25 = KCTC 12864 = JCM 14565]